MLSHIRFSPGPSFPAICKYAPTANEQRQMTVIHQTDRSANISLNFPRLCLNFFQRSRQAVPGENAQRPSRGAIVIHFHNARSWRKFIISNGALLPLLFADG